MIYNKQYGLEAINLIMPNMYGPGFNATLMQSHVIGGLVIKICDAKMYDQPNVTLWGTGKPIREFLYIDDGAEMAIRALYIKHTKEPINIGIGKGISIIELANMIKEVVGYEGDIVLDKQSSDGAPCKIMNVERMKGIFSWTPKTDLKEGIEETVRWYMEPVC